jgi:hypothetical protein
MSDRVINTKGAVIHVVESGAGEPALIFLQRWPSCSRRHRRGCDAAPDAEYRDFRLPTILHPLATANSILVRRDNPLQMTLLPGGPSLALARYPPSLASLIR